MVFTTAISTTIAILVSSVYVLYWLAADAAYIVLFPQLTAALFMPDVNAYGSFIGYIVGVILRLGGGDTNLGLTPFIVYPYYDKQVGQLFPYKTFSMLISMFLIWIVSKITKVLFCKGILPQKLDFVGVSKDKSLNYNYIPSKSPLGEDSNSNVIKEATSIL